jgi:predicted GH43/DUF377 family glycosyl hydrolase
MSRQTSRDLVHRWKGNPLIGLEDLNFRVGDIHNAAVAEKDGQIILLLNIESLQGHNLFYRATSTDGITFTVNNQPVFIPADDGPRAPYETYGIRDPRITALDDTFYIVYIADSELGLRLGMARTEDFNDVEFLGYISQPDMKNGVLFPRKFNNRYAILKRPSTGYLWMSFSDDLTYWGDERVVMGPRGGYWDANRVGAAAVPIEVEAGWLLIYYGAKDTSAGPLVRLGAVLLDRDDPSHVIARSNIPILSPREHYERVGDIGNMVFTCGAMVRDEEIWIYYGASDSCIALGTVKIQELVDFCLSCAIVQDYLETMERQL